MGFGLIFSKLKVLDPSAESKKPGHGPGRTEHVFSSYTLQLICNE
jgi:hypothetical protein